MSLATTARHFKPGAAPRTKPILPCVSCKDPEGYFNPKRGNACPIRVDGSKFGFAGEICNSCYGAHYKRRKRELQLLCEQAKTIEQSDIQKAETAQICKLLQLKEEEESSRIIDGLTIPERILMVRQGLPLPGE